MLADSIILLGFTHCLQEMKPKIRGFDLYLTEALTTTKIAKINLNILTEIQSLIFW